ncbi:alpha/beta hydrolase [soil metagenome]
MTSIFDSDELNQRLFFPRRDRSRPPERAVELEVPGAVMRHVRCHRWLDEAPTLLLFHGNGEVTGDYDASARHFARCGVNLAVMDYRGYGRSEGTPTFRNMIEDAHRVFEAVNPQFIMGRSLGSACMAELYATSFARGFVFESGFVDLEALVERRGLKAMGLRDRGTFDPLPKLARGTAPLLVLHGEDDTIISADEGRRAYAAAGTTDKQLVLVPDHGHNDLSHGASYWKLPRGVHREVVVKQTLREQRTPPSIRG